MIYNLISDQIKEIWINLELYFERYEFYNIQGFFIFFLNFCEFFYKFFRIFQNYKSIFLIKNQFFGYF